MLSTSRFDLEVKRKPACAGRRSERGGMGVSGLGLSGRNAAEGVLGKEKIVDAEMLDVRRPTFRR